MKLCAKDLRNPVALQRFTAADDGAGGSVLTWADVGTLWCDIVDLSGSEVLEHDKVESRETTRFTCRYWEDVSALDRLAIDGVTYAIRFVNNEDFRDVWTIIDAEAGVTDAQP